MDRDHSWHFRLRAVRILGFLLAVAAIGGGLAAACSGDNVSPRATEPSTSSTTTCAAGSACGANGMGGMTMGGSMGSMMGDMGSEMMANDEPGVISVGLMTWAVMPRTDTAKAGAITFRANNMPMTHAADGSGKVHELAIAKKRPDGQYEVLASTGQIQPGTSKDLVVTLDPGEYVLQCSIVEEIHGKLTSHYTLGMHTPFYVN